MANSSAEMAVVRAKLRMVQRLARQVRSHHWVHIGAGLMTVALVVGIVGAFFGFLFRFLLRADFEPFGAPLLERLLGVVLLAFFSMLIFSNLIITLTTTYISKETEFLIGMPLRFRELFRVKLAESLVYSSWAFVLLSMPMFFAYGWAKGAPVAYYPVCLLVGLPFLLTPAALGALATMLLSAALPARKARVYTVGLVAVVGVAVLALVKLMGVRNLLAGATLQDFGQLMQVLSFGSLPASPNYWLAQALSTASEGRWGQCAYWTAMLTATGAMAVQVCLWLVPRYYYRGWGLAKESGGTRTTTGGLPLMPAFDRLFRAVMPRPVAALFGKDMRTFWRDPAQWSQIVIMLGVLVLYLANIRGLKRELAGLENYVRHWPTILWFFNIAAVCFIVSILTTRFVYPMLSLEGKQYWMVGLAPFKKGVLVWQKFWLCAGSGGVVVVGLSALSNGMLGVSAPLAALGLAMATLTTLGLSSLAVGLGAIFPNFREDNPAQIANGVGGTINILLSLAYVAVSIGLMLWPVLHFVDVTGRGLGAAAAAGVVARSGGWLGLVALALHGVAIAVPLRMGLNRWNNLEFHI